MKLYQIIGRIRERYNCFIIGRNKKSLLEKYNWYPNGYGTSWHHPHGFGWIDTRDILRLTPNQLEYKLQHGSLSHIPEEIR